MKKIIKIISIVIGIIIVLSIASRIVLNIMIKNSVSASNDDLQKAEEFLMSNYESLVITDMDKEVNQYHKNSYADFKKYLKYEQYDEDNFYVSYIFKGTMDTPEAKNDNVIIFVSNSKNSPYYVTNDDIEWSITIRQNKADGGKKWDYSFTEHKM